MEPQRALRKIRKVLDKEPDGHPTLTPILEWENKAHDFKRDMTKILGRACWKLLAVLRPPDEWPMETRSSRESVIKAMVRHTRLIYFELEEVEAGRLPDDPVGRCTDVREHMDSVDRLFNRVMIPRTPAPPEHHSSTAQFVTLDNVYLDLLINSRGPAPASSSGSASGGTGHSP